MKNFLPVLLLALLFLAACNDEIDLIEEGNDIPLVYGFVDLGDTAQYIRVERAFASEDQSAFELAKIKDSIYYQNVVVKLINEETGTEIILEQVNGNDEGYQRDAGDFLVDPNILYKVRTSDLDFLGGEGVRLELERGDNLPTVTAQSIILDSLELQSPTQDRSVVIGYKTTRFNFFTTPTVALMGLEMHLKVLETNPNDPSDSEIVTVIWEVEDEFIPETSMPRNFSQIQKEGIGMYSALAAQLDPNKDVIRKMLGFDLVAFGAAKEVLEFRRIASANRGLTGSQELPNYSNLSEGLGIFSSKYRANYNNFTFGGITLDSIANGRITKDLGFIF